MIVRMRRKLPDNSLGEDLGTRHLDPFLLDAIATHSGIAHEEVTRRLEQGRTVWTNHNAYYRVVQ